MSVLGCGQHGPNDVALNEPFANTSEARSTGGFHLMAFAYRILNNSFNRNHSTTGKLYFTQDIQLNIEFFYHI